MTRSTLTFKGICREAMDDGLTRSEVHDMVDRAFDEIGREAAVELYGPRNGHDCWDHGVQYTSDGALGHGWECGVCGKFLQAG